MKPFNVLLLAAPNTTRAAEHEACHLCGKKPQTHVAAGLPGCQLGAYKTPNPGTAESGESPILCTPARAGAVRAIIATRQTAFHAPGDGGACRGQAGVWVSVHAASSMQHRRRRWPAVRRPVIGAAPRRLLSGTWRVYDGAFTHPTFLRKMAFSHAAPFLRNTAASSGLACLLSDSPPPVRAPINMTDQNRASASSVPFRLFDPVH